MLTLTFVSRFTALITLIASPESRPLAIFCAALSSLASVGGLVIAADRRQPAPPPAVPAIPPKKQPVQNEAWLGLVEECSPVWVNVK